MGAVYTANCSSNFRCSWASRSDSSKSALAAGAGFAEFASPWSALSAPAAFLCLHLFEGQLITPHLVGRRLELDPVMVFLALVVLGWIWGVAGLLLAVPLMACTKIIAARVPGGQVVATLLSR